MNHSYPRPKPRREPSWLEVIGFSVVMMVGFAACELAVEWLIGQAFLNWLMRFAAWLTVWTWAWRRMGWQA